MVMLLLSIHRIHFHLVLFWVCHSRSSPTENFGDRFWRESMRLTLRDWMPDKSIRAGQGVLQLGAVKK